MTSHPPIPNAGSLDASALGASLTVAALDSSLAWYRDVLGFTVARTFDREGKMYAASLRAGAVAILLTQDDGARGANRVKGDGMSLQITTAQNIDDLAARVREHGATIESGPADVMGARMFRLRDPDGFKFVFSSPR